MQPQYWEAELNCHYVGGRVSRIEFKASMGCILNSSLGYQS